ncbi:MAG: GNAT family N-acetyltransferase [Alphaproteobacteria bacterium]
MNAPNNWSSGTPVRLETPRFVLRSVGPSDVNQKWADWTADHDVMKGMNPNPSPMTQEMLRAQLRGYDNRGEFILGIYDKSNFEHVGIYRVNTHVANRIATTNVVIGDTNYWGKNVVLETRAALIDFLFDHVNVEKIDGRPFARNLPAIFNYKAQGFVKEGTMRKQVRVSDTERWDQFLFGLLPEDWENLRDNPKVRGVTENG